MIPRRAPLAAGPAALAACRTTEDAYFGRTDPPERQRLVSVLGVEPGSLDPATSVGLLEDCIIYALFEGLTRLHPVSGEAMPGLATHYEVTLDTLRYTFHLRGYPGPRGIRLPNREELPVEYSQGRRSVSAAVPAKWSDGGTPITTTPTPFRSKWLCSSRTSMSLWPWLAKPFVKELGRNLLDRQQLKYIRIDTKWRS